MAGRRSTILLASLALASLTLVSAAERQGVNCTMEPLSDAEIAAIEQHFLDSWNEKYPSAQPEPTPTLIPNGGYTADVKTGLRAPIGIERVEPPGC